MYASGAETVHPDADFVASMITAMEGRICG